MLLDHARELKSSLLSAFETKIEAPAAIRSLGIRTQALGSQAEALRSFAIGISKAKKEHVLAVRVQRRSLLDHPMLETIKKRTKGEIDVRYVGKISKLETPSTLQKKRRPMVIGCSIGHFKITAGTLGCFVKLRTTQKTMILSNNHVLANENNARAGDAILQPGNFDGGTAQDAVAKLFKFIKLKKTAVNFVDCAIAEPLAGITFNQKKLGTFGNLLGLGPDVLGEGNAVRKVGRTTGETQGSVTAFELDNVVVAYDLGNVRFDNQVEIEGSGTSSFSDGGDSGSLIVNADNLGVALLFAGGDTGGSNNMGLTYANPLKAVLDALSVDLVF